MNFSTQKGQWSPVSSVSTDLLNVSDVKKIGNGSIVCNPHFCKGVPIYLHASLLLADI